jgi:pyrroloquinoline quinone (PQQ) biosynthesis protein C
LNQLKAYAFTAPRAQVSARSPLKKFWPKSNAVTEKYLLDFLDMFKAECTVFECRKSVQCEYSTEVPDCVSLHSAVSIPMLWIKLYAMHNNVFTNYCLLDTRLHFSFISSPVENVKVDYIGKYDVNVFSK